jgi:sugar lactone lactonase YvrE
MTDVETWIAGGYELAEGARRVGDDLLFVDILTGRLLSAANGQARVVASVDVPLGAVAPVAGRPGEWVAAAGTGIALLSGSGGIEWIDRPEDGGRVATRMNDGACDPHGRFWAGSMAYDGTPGCGSLYRVEPDGTVERLLTGFTVVNGPAFDVAGSLMYLADTPTGRILRYSLDPSGAIVDGGVFISVGNDEGSPDGMTVDDAGRLWVAMWGGSRVNCYAPTGERLAAIRLPARQPTSVCLGAHGLLYVTSAAYGLPAAGNADGAVLRVPVDASAPPARPWG